MIIYRVRNKIREVLFDLQLYIFLTLFGCWCFFCWVYRNKVKIPFQCFGSIFQDRVSKINH